MRKPKKNILQVSEAYEHNLQNINVDIPHNAITVITGISGSGKSSLAYNVIFKESQRRFLESFSTYSRQYLGKLEKPKVKEIKGLQAALAINQKTGVSNPRSTVGTMSGVYDYLRLLYAREGKRCCTHCNHIITDKQAGNCENCGTAYPKLLAKLFSFNSKFGACPHCTGLGVSEQIDQDKLIADENKSLREAALVPTTPTGYIVYSQVRVDELNKVCLAHGFNVDIPWKDLSPDQQKVVMFGSDRIKILFGKHALESRLKWKGITAKPREEAFYKGMIPIMEDILKRDRNDNILRFASSFSCGNCGGLRVRKEALAVSINNKNIAELSQLSLADLDTFLKNLSAANSESELISHIVAQAIKRLEYLQLLGLNYLSLSRGSTTLSGGEAQRIRLASQLGSGLQGILYILDEPSIGLHPRDNKKLIRILQTLRDNGNTVLVVEHDEEIIKSADYLIDIGPKAGKHGGKLIYQGDSKTLLNNPTKFQESLTAISISNAEQFALPLPKRLDSGYLQLKGASKNNLKSIDVEFRLNALNLVTGVSGAGKSSLVHHVLAKALKTNNESKHFQSIECSKKIARIIEIDQSPIGRTPRSNPATYTDLFDHIREIFSQVPESKKRGYKKGRFSFNNKGGRCENCQGAGSIQLGMHFLGDVEIICETCNGQRFNSDTLEIKYRGKNIYEVLELSVEEAFRFFEGKTKALRILDQLLQLDIGYLKLGQPSTTLSGGEAQRIKLASELYKTSKGHNLYILDEPSVGLHKADVNYLMKALQKIIEDDNTVIVIEHDTDIIKQADHIIDLGPEGGEQGGYLVVQGSVDAVMKCESSFTGIALQNLDHRKDNTTLAVEGKKSTKNIVFKGVTTHNLKGIDIEIPLYKTTVITGVSGSGKSSLAFDTIYAESRNRYTESLSTYARRMMNKVKKAELEHCYGLTPAIGIRQNQFRKNPRSTVGTATEVYDLYRLLFSRAGQSPVGSFTKLSASDFSFNKIESACDHCKGLGVKTTADIGKLISHPGKALTDGAMDGSIPGKYFGDPFGQFVNTLTEVGRRKNINFSIPFSQLSAKAIDIALFGTGQERYDIEWKFKRGKRSGIHKMSTVWKGFVNYINEEYDIKKEGKRGQAFQYIMHEQSCAKCKGNRLQDEALSVRFDNMNIAELASKSIQSALQYFNQIDSSLDINTWERSRQLIDQLQSKLSILNDIGLGYISIDRPTSSLSGGEAQRLRIATQLVSDLCGLTYILDEPTIGLHPHDTQSLMNAIRRLKENGNTVVIVEHDPEVIKQADHIIDMGPGAGSHGGQLIGQGNLKSILKQKESITAHWIQKKNQVYNANEKKLNTPGIQISSATANNLKNIDLAIPMGGLVAITGLSGSGKTSLAIDVVAHSFRAGHPQNCKSISFPQINDMVLVGQQKIGSSPLSTPATYTGLFDIIREEFAKLPESKALGLKKSHFSFNSKGGRCETCKGMGHIKVSMDFLSDVYIPCDTCHGKRYNDKILKPQYNGHSIADILMMEASQALPVFEGEEKITQILQSFKEIGLGYVQLGQATSTLSGGETQRLKLLTHLLKKQDGNTLFIFDEPSTGLHMQDVNKLISVFHKLVASGHTVLVIEHNMDIIRSSDWIIDLGPEGGDKGGTVVYSGIVAGIASINSYTSMALRNDELVDS